MVTCKLNGGLGNQMFQIAATIGLAKKHGVEFRIPVMTENGDDPNSNHQQKGRFVHFPALTIDSIPYVYKEPSFLYKEILYVEDICLDGYFQSEKYFEHCREDILDAFGIRTNLLIDFCSIHVRRGDYLSKPDIHTNLGMDYYDKAIKHMKKNTLVKKFMVFSDDIDWCRRNFIGDEFSFAMGNSEIDDMILMSRCKYHIIANSSFSWWGSVLCNNQFKVIVAPEKWFGAGSGIKDWSSIYTKEMVVL